VLAGACGAERRRGECRHARGFLEEILLGPLDPDDARALVTRPVGGLFRYEPRAVERILQLADGRPYLIQKLCLDALNHMLDDCRTTVLPADVDARRGPGCRPSLATCRSPAGR